MKQSEETTVKEKGAKDMCKYSDRSFLANTATLRAFLDSQGTMVKLISPRVLAVRSECSYPELIGEVDRGQKYEVTGVSFSFSEVCITIKREGWGDWLLPAKHILTPDMSSVGAIFTASRRTM